MAAVAADASCRRENAKIIFRNMMEAEGGELPASAEGLAALKGRAVEVKLMDESARELMKEYSRRCVLIHFMLVGRERRC